MPSKWFEITGAERIARIPEKFTELVAEDVARVSFADALERGALSDLYPVTYLRMCAESRTWKGKPSTTQLMKGTRQAFLEIKKTSALIRIPWLLLSLAPVAMPFLNLSSLTPQKYVLKVKT